ncbi:MAG: signal peptidase II [Chloroflexi bacterium]|nr:signal peptidase II [Chloroflexota bacterium]
MFKLQSKTAKSLDFGLAFSKRRNVVFFLTAVLVIIADQLTKEWVRSFPENYAIFKTDIVQIVRIHNPGAAFGAFQDYSLALAVIALIAVLVILLLVFFFWRRFSIFDSLLARTALGLILGGTAGNLIDRLRFGHVTDFIDFRIWPSFNVADASISVGIVLFAYSLFFMTKAVKR